MPDNPLKAYGVVCNHIGDHMISRGSKCYVTWFNRGNGSNSVQIWTRNRGGRAIVKIVNLKQLRGFRAAWIPQHIRNWKGVINAELSFKATARETAMHLTQMLSAHAKPKT